MTKIRVAIRVNPGRRGAPLKKLADIYEDLYRFFMQSTSDLNIGIEGQITVHDFRNGSVACIADLEGEFGEEQIDQYQNNVSQLTRYRPNQGRWTGVFGAKTLDTYAQVGSHLDTDECLEIGFIDPVNEPDWDNIDWDQVSKAQAKEVKDSVIATRNYYGAIFGKIHTLYKESDKPHFTVREVINKTLVPCYYSDSQYKQVVTLLNRKDVYVHVAGLVVSNSIKGEIESVLCERMEAAPDFKESSLNGLFGSAPSATGDLSTDEYLKKFWGEE